MLAVVVIVIVMFMAWWFTNPLNSAIAVIKKMADGHFDQRIEINDFLHTELAELAESSNYMAEKLDMIETSRREFVSNVSHELKTPLSSIKVLSDSILIQDPENVPKEMYVEFLMDINSEVDRMTDIINDLLTLVRMNREEVHLNPMEINLTDMISDIVRRLEPIAKSKNINLNYNKLKAVKAEIEETKFSLAVSNLIENAIKYNNDGGNVEVTVDADNQNAFVTIADDGVGIAEEELGKIFDRFYRVDKNRALEVAAPSPVLTAQTMPGIRPTREIKPVGVRSFGDTVYVFDFGENMSGLCRLKISGERGMKVEMQHGELLKDNGRVEMRNIDIYYDPMPGLGFQTDYYTLKGDGEETFTPDFNYHGFRWVEVRSDRPMKLDENSLTALCMHTAVEPVGEFRCSNDMLNEVWKATRRAYLANLMSIPTDCPQREKNGWTADAALAIDLALLNYDGILFYEKWFDDVADNIREDGRIAGIIPTSSWGYDDWIGPVWDASILIIPNAIYNYYGDKRTIEKIYPTVEKYLTYLKTREDSTGLVTYGIGDWVFYKTQTPTAYTSSCFYYLDYALMSRFAELTGRDAALFREKAERIREAVNRIYFDSTAASYANGSQAALAVALGLGIVPEGYEQRVADNLAKAIEDNDFHLDFGTLGSKYALRMLTRYGHGDVAYKMASQKDCPSWGWWIEQGFTTLAETWALSPEFRDASVNHVFLGDISAWMVSDIAGINFDPERPGYRHIVFRPHFFDGLDWAEAEYRSVSGPIRSRWERKGDRVVLTVTVPVNSTATVEAGGKTVEVGAGTHDFKF